MQMDRRHFSGMLAATLALRSLPAAALTVRGVDLGLQTYAFHEVREGGVTAVEEMISVMKQLDVTLCEMWSPLLEPFPLPTGYWAPWSPGVTVPPSLTAEENAANRKGLRAWRIQPPAGYFEGIRRSFDKAGIRIFAYNYSFDASMTDEEIDAGFLHAKALGLDLITASSTLSTARRVVRFAAKHEMRVAFHGHSEKDDPDQVAGPNSFAKVLAMSRLYRVNLDVAHFASAGFDAVAYIKKHHAQITNIHVHDRKANAGASVPFGEGVAPTREVLLLLRDKQWKIPVFYELEYVGAEDRSVQQEIARELSYERSILNS